MSDTYGPTSEMPLARYDLPSQSWRTCEDTSLWDLPMSLATLPAWGMTQGGVLFELQKPERPTVEREFSSLPTPHAGLGERGRDGVYPNPNGQQDLQHAIAHLLPTPRAQNGEERNQNIWARPADQPQNLENALAHVGALTCQPLSDGSASLDLYPIRLFQDQSATASTQCSLNG